MVPDVVFSKPVDNHPALFVTEFAVHIELQTIGWRRSSGRGVYFSVNVKYIPHQLHFLAVFPGLT
jgi:hypothetical protein